MTRPVQRPVHVTEHDGGRGLQAQRVGGSHYLQPLGRIQLVRAQYSANLVIKNFRRGARQVCPDRPASIPPGRFAAAGPGFLPLA